MKRVVVTGMSFLVLVPAGLGVLHNRWFGQGIPVRVPSHATVSVDGTRPIVAKSHPAEPSDTKEDHMKSTDEHHARHDEQHAKHGDKKKEHAKTAAVPRGSMVLEGYLLPTRSSQPKPS